MSKKNGANKDRQGADKIRKAERKLASALAEVDEARAKVARRERKLSALLLKYGPADGPSPDLAPIPATEDAVHASSAEDEAEQDASGEEDPTTIDNGETTDPS